jgi:ribonucleoside-diphosphate reductase alpha chain
MRESVGESSGFHRGKMVPTLLGEVTPSRSVPNLVEARQTARLQGFTGDVCSTCQGVHMQMAGHCMVCADCGTTTGCS